MPNQTPQTTPQTTPTSRPNPDELVRQLVGLSADERAAFAAAYLEGGDLDHILQAVPRLAAPDLQAARERLAMLLPANPIAVAETAADAPPTETQATAPTQPRNRKR